MGSETNTEPRFLTRLVYAGTNLIIPPYAVMIVTYYVLREWGGNAMWLVEALGFISFWLFVPLVLLLPAALWRRSRVLLTFLLAPLALFFLSYGGDFLPKQRVRTDGNTFSVMAYNVYAGNPHTDRIAAVIETETPDIIGLHELQIPIAQTLERDLGEQYPYRQIDPGIGLFSRYPILECESFRPDRGRGLWAQQCVVDIHGNRVTILNAHPRSPPLKGIRPFGLPLSIPLGFASEARDAEVRDLIVRRENVDGPLLVIGDFNLTEHQSIYQELTRNLHDAHRESGRGLGFTFTYGRALKIPLWRIDFVLHSSDLVALSTKVGDTGGSDHRPVTAQLAFREDEGVAVEASVETFEEYQAENQDLRGRDLWFVDLHQANLRMADLREADLEWADLRGADLREADLDGARLAQASLHGARLDDSTQIDARWRLAWELVNVGGERRDLTGSVLVRADLHSASLRGADLSRANLSNAILYRADLSGTNLSDAVLKGANASQADFSGADLSGVDLSHADLNRAILRQANLSRANLSGVHMLWADLRGANLRGADLSNAYLGCVDLSQTDLQGANLEGAILHEVILPAGM